MMRALFALLVLVSCSTVKTGGEDHYSYDFEKEHSNEDLKRLAPQIVATSMRDPQVGTLDKLFGKGQRPLKRVGIIIFETEIQPTRGGLADHDKIYLSAQGKQLLTEKLLSVWEEIFTTFQPDIEYVPTSKVKASKVAKEFGLSVDDYVHGKRHAIEPDDIFYLDRGQETTTVTVLNPRKMRDLSFVLVPATELMSGPKWSEQNKQYVNEVSKALKLDAAIIIMSKISWTTNRIDKHSGEAIAEEVKFDLTASTLVSLSQYRERAEKLKLKDPLSVSLCYRHYEAKLAMPVDLGFSKDEASFELIQERVLNPTLKTYRDLTFMMVDQLSNDLRKTF